MVSVTTCEDEAVPTALLVKVRELCDVVKEAYAVGLLGVETKTGVAWPDR